MSKVNKLLIIFNVAKLSSISGHDNSITKGKYWNRNFLFFSLRSTRNAKNVYKYIIWLFEEKYSFDAHVVFVVSE